ncbi:MAG: pre-peptidase C-terminal domain-containing protein, partial [Chitinophagaceae bacterium]|nr:pre-peptidase C-terminal domain-containing protein [Anaerolineae bacterium]
VRIRVLATDGTTFDPVAALLDPAGTVIAEADDSEGLNPVMTLELPADGTYSVRVNGYLTSGAYTVLVEELF